MSSREDDPGAAERFAVWLRAAREAAGLSQTAAAERSPFSRTHWQTLELGKRADGRPVNPKSQTVIGAAVAVGRDPREALEQAGLDPSGYEPARAGRPSTSVAEIRDLFALLTEPQRRALADLLRTLVDPTPGSTATTAEPFREGGSIGGAEPRRGR